MRTAAVSRRRSGGRRADPRRRAAAAVEIDPSVPEPLQAIALTAMERDPRAVISRRSTWRPTCGATSTDARCTAVRRCTRRRSDRASRPHLDEIGEWLRLRLIYPHEAERLRSAYRALDAREEDWIVESRALSYTQIALYLGAFLLLCGSLFYFVAARWYEHVDGVLRPFVVLGASLHRAERRRAPLYRRDHKAVAVAFYLAAVVLLPLFLLILFDEARLLRRPRQTTGPAVR